jgi:hypothetical protein
LTNNSSNIKIKFEIRHPNESTRVGTEQLSLEAILHLRLPHFPFQQT